MKTSWARDLSAAVLVFLNMGPVAQAQSADEIAKSRDEIWSKEQTIYKGRAAGNIDFYIESTSPAYLGWPPTAGAPLTQTDLKARQVKGGPAHEKLTLELTGFTRSGDTAMIYYTTHMTVSGDGTPVDKRYDNIHVWTLEKGSWRLMGGMARPEPAPSTLVPAPATAK